MVQGGDQHIRIGGGEELLVSAREAEGGHPSRFGRVDAGHRVRNAEALLRRHAQLFARREEHLRMRLPLREVAARYIGVEDSRRVSPGFTRRTSRPFSSATVSRRIWRRKRPALLEEETAATWIPASLYRDDEAQSVRVGGERTRVLRVSDYRGPADFARSFRGRGLSSELGAPPRSSTEGVLRLLLPRQAALRERWEIHFVQRRDNDVGVGGSEGVRLAGPCQADDGHVGRLRRLYTGDGVLDREAPVRGDAQLSRGGKEDLGMGLAAMGEIPSRDVRVENVEQGDARPDEVVAKTLAIGEGIESDLAE